MSEIKVVIVECGKESSREHFHQVIVQIGRDVLLGGSYKAMGNAKAQKRRLERTLRGKK